MVQSTLAQSSSTEDEVVALSSLTNCCPERSWPEAERAICQELALLGIDVQIIHEKKDNSREFGGDPPADVNNATATIRISKSTTTLREPSGLIELWFRSPTADEPMVRTLELNHTDAPDAVTVAAVRTVNLLRIRLDEKRGNGSAVEPKYPSVQSSSAEHSAKGSTNAGQYLFLIGAGGDLLYSPGGTGFGGGFALSAAWFPLPLGGLMVEAMVAPFGKKVTILGPEVDSGAAGDAGPSSNDTSAINLVIFRGWVRWTILQHAGVMPYLAVGGGTAIVTGKGAGVVFGADRSETDTAGHLAGRLGVQLNLSQHIAIGVNADIGVLVPRIEIYHQKQMVASLGRPLGELGVCLFWRLP